MCVGRRVVDEDEREEKKDTEYRMKRKRKEREKKRKERKQGMVVVCSPSLCSTSDAKKRGHHPLLLLRMNENTQQPHALYRIEKNIVK